MPAVSLYGGVRNSGATVGVDATGVASDCGGRSVLFVSAFRGVGAASNFAASRAVLSFWLASLRR